MCDSACGQTLLTLLFTDTIGGQGLFFAAINSKLLREI
jgi:hypothetical protein